MTKFIKSTEEIYEFVKILGQQTDFQQVVRLVAEKSTQILKADFALIIMLNPDTRKTVKTIFKNGVLQRNEKYKNIRIHIGGWIVKNKKPFFSTNIQKDCRFVHGLFDRSSVKSAAGVPLIIEGIIIGAVILLFSKPPKFIKENELINVLEQVAAIISTFFA